MLQTIPQAKHMPNHIKFLLFSFSCLLISGCFGTEETTVAPEPTTEELEVILSEALEEPKLFQDDLRETCPAYRALLLEVAETVQMGSRIWNAGGAPITIRIYEGVIYRILYEVDDQCPRLSHAFLGGLNRADAAESINDRGIALRSTLDLVMGGPPAKPPGAH